MPVNVDLGDCDTITAAPVCDVTLQVELMTLSNSAEDLSYEREVLLFVGVIHSRTSPGSRRIDGEFGLWLFLIIFSKKSSSWLCRRSSYACGPYTGCD